MNLNSEQKFHINFEICSNISQYAEAKKIYVFWVAGGGYFFLFLDYFKLYKY